MSRLKICLIGLTLMLIVEGNAISSEWNDSDALPEIYSVSFSSGSVGFVDLNTANILTCSYHLMDRNSLKIKNVEREKFKDIFPQSKLCPDKFKIPYFPPQLSLYASDGKEFLHYSSDCRGEKTIGHKLMLSGVPIHTQMKPCNDISALDTIGDQLWLVTYAIKGGDFFGKGVGEGIIVQSLSSSTLLGRIDTDNRVANILRWDPYTKKMWAVFPDGFETISTDFKKGVPHYWNIGFDSQAYVPAVVVSTFPLKLDTFAYLGQYARVKDKVGYYKAVSQIPEDFKEKVEVYGVTMGFYEDTDGGGDGIFAPKELNSLVPYFIASAESDNPEGAINAMETLCMFNDPRVYQTANRFIRNRAGVQIQTESWSSHQKSLMYGHAYNCIKKFKRLNIAVQDE